jgi:hypothetical protein
LEEKNKHRSKSPPQPSNTPPWRGPGDTVASLAALMAVFLGDIHSSHDGLLPILLLDRQGRCPTVA